MKLFHFFSDLSFFFVILRQILPYDLREKLIRKKKLIYILFKKKQNQSNFLSYFLCFIISFILVIPLIQNNEVGMYLRFFKKNVKKLYPEKCTGKVLKIHFFIR